MLGYTVLVAAAAVVVVVRLILGRRMTFHLKGAVLAVEIALAVIGAILALVASHSLEEATAVKNWPTIEGTVVDSRVVGERAFGPAVTYEYAVGDSQYTATSNLRAPMFGGKRKKFEVARKLVEEYPIGKRVTVYYSPANPSKARLFTGAGWDVYAKLGLGVTLFALGLFGLLLTRSKDVLTERE